MDKYRYDNRSGQWGKRTAAKLRGARQLAGIPKRLIFVTVAAMSAFVTQFVLHSSRAPQIHLSSQISLSPGLIAGVASVIDGDTIEIRGQRIRFNGIDAPEAGSFVTTRAAPTIRAAGDRPKR